MILTQYRLVNGNKTLITYLDKKLKIGSKVTLRNNTSYNNNDNIWWKVTNIYNSIDSKELDLNRDYKDPS